MGNTNRGRVRAIALIAIAATTPTLRAHLRLCATDQRYIYRGRLALRTMVPTLAMTHIAFEPMRREGILYCVPVTVTPVLSIPSPNFQRLAYAANNSHVVRIIISDSRPLCAIVLDNATSRLAPFANLYVDHDAMGLAFVPTIGPVQSETLYSCSPEVEIYMFWDHRDMNATAAHELVHAHRFLAAEFFQHCGSDRFPACEEVDRLIRESYDEVIVNSHTDLVLFEYPAFIFQARAAPVPVIMNLQWEPVGSRFCCFWPDIWMGPRRRNGPATQVLPF